MIGAPSSELAQVQHWKGTVSDLGRVGGEQSRYNSAGITFTVPRICPIRSSLNLLTGNISLYRILASWLTTMTKVDKRYVSRFLAVSFVIPDSSYFPLTDLSQKQRITREGDYVDTSKPTAFFKPSSGREWTVSVAVPGSILST